MEEKQTKTKSNNKAGAAGQLDDLNAVIKELQNRVKELESQLANNDTDNSQCSDFVLGDEVASARVFEARSAGVPCRVLRIDEDMWIAMPSNSSHDKKAQLTWVPFNPTTGTVTLDPALQLRCQDYMEACDLVGELPGYASDFLAGKEDDQGNHRCHCKSGSCREELSRDETARVLDALSRLFW